MSRGRHLYSAERPSRWALAHILVHRVVVLYCFHLGLHCVNPGVVMTLIMTINRIVVRPHRIATQMRIIIISTDGVVCFVCLSVCRSVGRYLTNVRPAKTAEPIEMSFGLWTRVGPRKHTRRGAHCRDLANTMEPSICGGDAALRQTNLTTCCRMCMWLCSRSMQTTLSQRWYLCEDGPVPV